MNNLTAPNTTAVGAPAPNYFQIYGDKVTQRTIVGKLLKYTKGDWLYGEDGIDMPLGTRLIANMDEIMIGWIRWQDNKPVEQIMGKLSEGYQPPPRDTLGHDDEDDWETDDKGQARDPWQLSNYMIMKIPGDNSEDALYTFAASSQGALKAVGLLCQTHGKRIRQSPDEFPIVELGTGSYDHPKKAYGRIKFPKLIVTGWTPKAEFVEALDAEQADAEQKPEPASNTTTKTTTAPKTAPKF